MKGLFFSTGGIHMATLSGMLVALKNDLSDIDYTGGISAGAFLSSLCATHTINEIESLLKKHAHDKLLQNRHLYFNTILSVLFNKSILKDDNLFHLISKLVGNRVLLRDLFIGVTDKQTMTYKVKHFKKGEVYDLLPMYILGSMSIPVLLPGVKLGKELLVDGGLFHTIPVEAIDMCIEKAMESKAKNFEVTILSARPFDGKKEYKKPKNFVIPNEVMQMVYSHGILTMHNDHIILNKTISNAKEHGLDTTLNFFSIPSKLVTDYDKKIGFQHYGSVKENMIDILLKEGERIIHKALHLDLKF